MRWPDVRQQLLQTLFHFLGSTAAEGNGQTLFRRNTMIGHQVGDPVRQRPRLAGSRPGDDQQRTADGRGGGTLVGIELSENCRTGGFGAGSPHVRRGSPTPPKRPTAGLPPTPWSRPRWTDQNLDPRSMPPPCATARRFRPPGRRPAFLLRAAGIAATRRRTISTHRPRTGGSARTRRRTRHRGSLVRRACAGSPRPPTAIRRGGCPPAAPVPG